MTRLTMNFIQAQHAGTRESVPCMSTIRLGYWCGMEYLNKCIFQSFDASKSVLVLDGKSVTRTIATIPCSQ